MDVENVKKLVELMKSNDLSEMEIVDGENRVVLKRTSDQPQVVTMAAPVAAVPGTPSLPAEAAPAAAESGESENLKEIVSPIVGTFYAAPSPNADSFVSVNAQVDEETVVGIVEAMKVMNEIKSEVHGTIKKILVKNGTAVEFGQPLFLVEVD